MHLLDLQVSEHQVSLAQNPDWLPQCLPNGIPLAPRYRRLLSHFTDDILASLSCHPTIHQDLGRGLVPAALESPQLMSACLALSAAGFLSRGVTELYGVDIAKILSHLQSSGLTLLRSALAGPSVMGETLLATCLIWCLSDVFTYRRHEGGMSSSWRVHLGGIRALLDSNGANYRRFPPGTGSSMQVAMRHLYQLYLSLQTLPYIAPAAAPPTAIAETAPPPPPTLDEVTVNPSPAIDGFLGYSDEILDVMHQIEQLSRTQSLPSPDADILLGKVHAMIARDMIAAPPVTLSYSSSSSSLTSSSPQFVQAESTDFTLCHQIFQQATLIQLHRRLYHLPSQSPPIQTAVYSIEGMLTSLCDRGKGRGGGGGGGESMWVAMAMPVFTLGCEAFTPEHQQFVLSMMDRLEICIQSLHVRIIRQALVDIWTLRRGLDDEGRGGICAGRLLGSFFSVSALSFACAI